MASGSESCRYEGLNAIGLKRRGFSSEKIKLIKDAYRILFQSGLLLANGLDKVKSELPQEPEIIEILDFFASNVHGRKFIKPFKN